MAAPHALRPGLEIEAVSWKGLLWLNIPRPSRAEMEYLRERFSFHPLDLDDCLSRVQLPKVDEYPDYLFLVLHFPVFNREARITRPSQVSIFVGADYVVTVHRGDLKPLVKLFQDAQRSEAVREDLMSRSSGFLLYRILDVLVDYCFPILNKLIQQVDELEERALDPTARTIQELAVIRRDIIAYRRIIRPQIAVMEALEAKEYPFLKVDPDVYFGDLADHTRRIWEELEELREVMEGLHDTIFTLSTQFSNDVMRILTVLFAALLPVTVVGTLYGMNVALPVQESPQAFWWLLAAAGVLSGVLFLYFWRRGWL